MRIIFYWAYSNLFKVYPHHLIAFSVAGGNGKREHYVFIWELIPIIPGSDIVTYKHYILRSIGAENMDDIIKLCISQGDKDHAIDVIRLQTSHHRHSAGLSPESHFVFLSGVSPAPCSFFGHDAFFVFSPAH